MVLSTSRDHGILAPRTASRAGVRPFQELDHLVPNIAAAPHWCTIIAQQPHQTPHPDPPLVTDSRHMSQQLHQHESLPSERLEQGGSAGLHTEAESTSPVLVMNVGGSNEAAPAQLPSPASKPTPPASDDSPRQALLLSARAFTFSESRRKRACESCRDRHRACDAERPCRSCRSLGVVCEEAPPCAPRAEPLYVNLDSAAEAAPNPAAVSRQPVPTSPAVCFFEFTLKQGSRPGSGSAASSSRPPTVFDAAGGTWSMPASPEKLRHSPSEDRRKRSVPMLYAPQADRPQKAAHLWSAQASSFKLEPRKNWLPMDGPSLPAQVQQAPQQPPQPQQHRLQQPEHPALWPASTEFPLLHQPGMRLPHPFLLPHSHGLAPSYVQMPPQYSHLPFVCHQYEPAPSAAGYPVAPSGPCPANCVSGGRPSSAQEGALEMDGLVDPDAGDNVLRPKKLRMHRIGGLTVNELLS
jgi:hypothetical protein